MCLFSVLDAMLDMPMNEAVENLSVSEDIKDVLIRGEGPFAPVHDIIRFYETGEGTPYASAPKSWTLIRRAFQVVYSVHRMVRPHDEDNGSNS